MTKDPQHDYHETSHLYCILDRVANRPGPLYEVANQAVAIRGYRQSLRNQGDPRDYDLLHIGTIDRPSLQISLLPAPKVIHVPQEEITA